MNKLSRLNVFREIAIFASHTSFSSQSGAYRNGPVSARLSRRLTAAPLLCCSPAVYRCLPPADAGAGAAGSVSAVARGGGGSRPPALPGAVNYVLLADDFCIFLATARQTTVDVRSVTSGTHFLHSICCKAQTNLREMCRDCRTTLLQVDNMKLVFLSLNERCHGNQFVVDCIHNPSIAVLNRSLTTFLLSRYRT